MPQNLYKSQTNKVFAGVCGGLAEYFKVDATLIRLAWALAFFLGGSGFILYILAMIIMPEKPVTEPAASPEPQQAEVPEREEPQGAPAQPPVNSSRNSGEEKRRQILGLTLVAVGGYFLLERFFPFFDFGSWWPLILIVIGFFILIKGKGGSR